MQEIYKFHKTLRSIRDTAMQRGVLALLDIGTSKIACLVIRFDDMGRQAANDGVGTFSGHANFRVIGAATTRSRGMRFGEINAMSETERAIRTAVQSAQKMAGVRVDHVMVSFSGAQPRSYGLSGEVDINDHVIDEGDIGRVMENCELPDFGDNRNIMHAQPVNFYVDHNHGIADPRGLSGRKLGTDMHVLTVDDDILSNIAYCIQRCDLELAGIANAGYASARASLVEDEQEIGAANIDLGGGTTSISIFLKKHMIYADSVRLGGDLVSSDISHGLQVPLSVAERIKTFYGGAVATGMDDREMIDIGGDSGDWEHDRRQVSRSELIGIMRPRVEEILEEVRARLDAAGFDHLPGQQIVLTGGGSQIPGLDGLASRILGANIRLGRPIRVQGLPQAATGPAFSGAVGLALFASAPQDEWWDFETPEVDLPTRSLRRAVKWFKDNW